MDAGQRILGVFDPLRNRISGILEGMTPRDRGLVYGLAIFFTLVVLVLGTMGMKSRLSGLEETLRTHRGQLAMVKELQISYEEGSVELEQVQQKLQAHQGTTLSTFLEKTADKVQIRDSLKQVKERSTTTMESMEEKQFTAQLRPIDLEQLVSFLYEVETSGYPLLIRSMTAKTIKVSGAKMLNVTFDISSFKLLEEQQEAGE